MSGMGEPTLNDQDIQDAAASTGDSGASNAGGFDSLESEYDSLLTGEGDTITIPKAQLQRYAQEHKSYRQKWGAVARTFEGYDPEQVETFGAFLGAINSGVPENVTQAVSWMRDQLEGLTPAQKREAIAEMKDQAKDAGMSNAEVKQVEKALKEEDIDAIVAKRLEEKLAERDRQQQVNAYVQEIKGHASRLADEHGLPDFANPDSPFYDVLLSTAQRLQSADRSTLAEAMNKAATQIMDRVTSAGQQLMSKKAAGAGRKVTPQVGAEPGGRNKPMTLADASAAAAARWDAMNRG
jgi:hypothetical protein